MSFFVYALCAVTSILCGVLLARQYQRSPSTLLWRSAVAFFCFALSNVLLFIDLIVVPQYDLRLIRNLASLGGILILLSALIQRQGAADQ